MSCWRKTTVLRIPAIHLGFTYWREWKEFLDKHEEEFDWSPGSFSVALCSSYSLADYDAWHAGGRDSGPETRLDRNLYPDHVKHVPGPFLDYYLEEISPLPPEKRSYHQRDCARPLKKKEKEKYLPCFQKLFPDFTLEKMEQVHYCRYEWYDGAEADYFY